MATNIKSNYLGGIYIQSGDGIPIHLSPLGSLYIDLNIPPSGYLSNGDGTWNSLGTISSGTSGFDVFVTGGTYNAGTAVFTNNTGGTFSVTGFSSGGGETFTGGTVSGATQFTGGLTANTYTTVPIISTGTTATTINLSLSDNFMYTLSGDTIFTFSNNSDGKSWLVGIKQNPITSGYTASFTATTSSVKWQNSVVPVMSPTIDSTDVFAFAQINSTIYGSYIQNF